MLHTGLARTPYPEPSWDKILHDNNVQAAWWKLAWGHPIHADLFGDIVSSTRWWGWSAAARLLFSCEVIVAHMLGPVSGYALQLALDDGTLEWVRLLLRACRGHDHHHLSRYCGAWQGHLTFRRMCDDN